MPRLSASKLFRFTSFILLAASVIASIVYALLFYRMLLAETRQPNQDELIDSRRTMAAIVPSVKGETNNSLPWYMEKNGYRPSSTRDRHHPQTRFTSDIEIWPGPKRGDRIEQQLMIAPVKEDLGRPLKIIFLPGGLDSWQLGQIDIGRHLFIRQKCPVNRCTLTESFDEGSLADAILLKDFDSTPSHQRPANQIWIMYTLESPLSMPFRQVADDTVNWTATYRHDSELVAPYEKWLYFNETQRKMVQTRNYSANKTKKVAWIVSNCASSNDRMEYAQSLAKYIDVDIYGDCGSRACPRDRTKDCIKDYKFYLSFENSNCRYYITEKFYTNGLGSGLLPIVMGAPRKDYEEKAPYNSFIHVDDFASPEELANYLHLLDKNDHLYNEYFEWIGTGVFINTYFYCRLCAMLHKADRAPPRVYRHFSYWWLNEQQCIPHL